jgi:predicted nucleotidyltransferase component of viral defense system
VVKRIGHVAYKLALPLHLAKIYDLFHVSLLRKADINSFRVLPQVSWEVKKDLTMDVKPIRILDQSEKELRNKKIHMVKVLWKSPQVEDTWEKALEMKNKYPELFKNTSMEI